MISPMPRKFGPDWFINLGEAVIETTLCCRSFGTVALIFSISWSNVDGL